MLDQDARIFHHHQSRPARPLRRRVILHAQLHPNYHRSHANGALHNRRHFFRPPENIHDLDFLRHFLQPRPTFLPQHFSFIRIHWNNPVARILHVFRHAIARPRGIRRQSDHGNRLIFFKDFCDGVGAGSNSKLSGIRQKHSHRAASSPVPARFASTCVIAARNLSFSSAVPTETRIASGNPIHPSGRTITPKCSNSSLRSFASGPTGTNTKLDSLGTGRIPSRVKPSSKRLRSVAFVSMHRLTCSSSSSAASA